MSQFEFRGKGYKSLNALYKDDRDAMRESSSMDFGFMEDAQAFYKLKKRK